MSNVPSDQTAEIIQRWIQRQVEWSRLGVQVDGAALAAEVVEDIESLASASASEELTLTAASALSGYSTDHSHGSFGEALF